MALAAHMTKYESYMLLRVIQFKCTVFGTLFTYFFSVFDQFIIFVSLQYELAALKHMCLQELVKKVDEETAAKKLVIADRYSQDEEGYKNSILMYISRWVFDMFICNVQNYTMSAMKGYKTSV